MEDYATYYEDNGRKKEGFMFYPYILYAVPGENVPLHWHEEIEIMYTKADGILMLDGKRIEYCYNDIFFFNSKQLHSTFHTSAGWAYHIVIHPDMFCSASILDNNDKRFIFPEKVESNCEIYRDILDTLLQIPSPSSDTDKLLIMKNLFALLYQLMSDGYMSIGENPGISAQTAYIKSAIKYINANLRKKISVQDIAGHLGITREYLMRLFKQYTGETVNSYIQSHRLESARKDLVNGYNLTDIVDKYDYTDTSYFCRLYKKQYGVSPIKSRTAKEP